LARGRHEASGFEGWAVTLVQRKRKDYNRFTAHYTLLYQMQNPITQGSLYQNHIISHI